MEVCVGGAGEGGGGTRREAVQQQCAGVNIARIGVSNHADRSAHRVAVQSVYSKELLAVLRADVCRT